MTRLLSRITTLYTVTERLFRLIMRKVGICLKELEKTVKAELLILDGFVLQAFNKQGRETLMLIIDDRYAKRSTIISSQIPVWYEINGGERTVSDAILDQIVNSPRHIDLKGNPCEKE